MLKLDFQKKISTKEKFEHKEERQMSESILIWILLAFAGGAMDAHSYLFRGSVFSNAQTGNILLFGVNLATKEFSQALTHMWPILAFMLGILLADRIRYSWHLSKLHWRQDSLIVELILILAVSFMPKSLDSLANSLLSLACGIQVESFRSVHNHAAASTMLVGNLRSLMASLDTFVRTHNKLSGEAIIIYGSLIIAFVIGAILESILIDALGKLSILLCATLLILIFILLCFKPKD